MKKNLLRWLVLALASLPAMLVNNQAFAQTALYGAGITAYGTLGASYRQGVTESWITESGIISKTTYAIEGTFSGFGGPGIFSGNFNGTGSRTDVQSVYSLNLHGFEMNGGSSMNCAAGIIVTTNGQSTASGVVEQSQNLAQGQVATFPFPGAYGTQVFSASQNVKVQVKSGP